MKYYSYEEFVSDTNKLIKKIDTYKPDLLVGIARGGLSLTHALSEALEIRDVKTISTKLYDDTKKRKEITISGDLDCQGYKKVLVVDDISDSGDTLKCVMDAFRDKNSDIEFRAVTLFYKKTSIYEPHFWINEAQEWIEFFWEKDFS